jgi:hypothetical protein
MTFKREAWVTYAALVPVVVGVIIASGVSSFLFYGSSIGYRIVDICFCLQVDLRLFGVFDFEFFEIDSCIASHAN